MDNQPKYKCSFCGKSYIFYTSFSNACLKCVYTVEWLSQCYGCEKSGFFNMYYIESINKFKTLCNDCFDKN
jgi:hypothetical protein